MSEEELSTCNVKVAIVYSFSSIPEVSSEKEG